MTSTADAMRELLKAIPQSQIHEIARDYYLCTQCRHETPIDQIMPFGSLKEMKKLYYDEELRQIYDYKNESEAIANPCIVGSSMFGSYFRFVPKEFITGEFPIYRKDSDNFQRYRSFVYDIDTMLTYIAKHQQSVPLAYYNAGNYYGYEQYGFVFHRSNTGFLKTVSLTLDSSLTDHEFVCRMPLPFTDEAGFIGKINTGTLTICNDYYDYGYYDYYDYGYYDSYE